MSKRAVVVVPGAEGGWIVRAFGREGIDSVRGEPTDVEIEGAVLVIDREVDGLEGWLKRFGGDALLVGWEPPGDERMAALGAVAFYPRPVHLAGMIRRVQTLLGGEALPATPSASSAPPPSGTHEPAAREVSADATLMDSDRPAPISELPETVEVDLAAPPAPLPTIGTPSGEPDLPPDDEWDGPDLGPRTPDFHGAPREPTVRLTVDEEAPTEEGEPSDDSPRPGVARPPFPSDGPPTLGESSMPPTAPSAGPSARRVLLSPRLAGLLRGADRRLFPNEDPLELTFPAGDEAPDVLVPDDLLADSATALEPREADPLDAFTFVGTPDLLDTASGSVSGEHESEVSVELTPHTVIERASRPPTARPGDRPESRPPDQSTAGGADITRSGTVPAGGALRMIFDLVQRRRPCCIRFEVAGGPEVELHLEGDVVLGVRGPRSQRALAALLRAGRLREGVGGSREGDREEAAAEALDDAVKRGELSAFERDRQLRLAAEGLLGEALLAAEARYTVSSADSGSPEASPVAGTLTAIAVEEARRRLDGPTVLRWLGITAGHRVSLERSFAARARDLGLEPEVSAAFVRSVGQPVRELLSAPPHAGLAGALFALCSADLVGLEAPPRSDQTAAALGAEALEAAIERAHATAEEGTYHAILGVEPGAGPRVLELARDERLAGLEGDLARLGLERLHPARGMAIDAIEEAFEVLSHPRWGQLYDAAGASPAAPRT